MKVHGIGWIEGRFGYNIHARNFFGALARRLDVTLTDIQQQPVDHAAVAADATVALLYGSHLDLLDGAPGWRIGYTVWESTRLPDDWFGPLQRLDRIWIPTAWGREVLVGEGFDPARIDVVPEGFDPAVFHPGVEPAEFVAARPGFKFLHVGRFEPRKGSRELIQAFDRAFGPEDQVRLVLMVDNPHEPEFDLKAELRALGLRRPGRLLVIRPQRRHEALARLYAACDVLVAPSRAEGWGLPILEAMACGRPVIATDYSGPTAFLGAHAFRLGWRPAPIGLDYFQRADGDRGTWAEPDWDALVELMRAAYRDPAAARARGAASAAEVHGRFTWDAAATTAEALLRSLPARGPARPAG